MRYVAKAGVLPFVCLLTILSATTALCLFYLWAGALPFGLLKLEKNEKIEVNSTVVFSQLKKEFKIISASRTVDTVVSGHTESSLPFSREEVLYWAFFNAEAVLDMSKMKDSDFRLVGKTVYIVLPEPELDLSLDLSKSRVISHDSQILSGPSQDPELTTKLQSQARKRAVEELELDGSLKSEAKLNAQNQIRIYLEKIGMTVSFNN